MREDAKGKTIVTTERLVAEDRLNDLQRAIDSSTAGDAAALVPFFGPTVTGADDVIDGIGLDLNRALMGGITYEWNRPFRAGETVQASVVFEDLVEKGSNQIGTVVAEFRDEQGELIQKQTVTFVERGGK